MASKIFISYRRRDSAGAAGRLYDFLEMKVGSKALFKDVDNIPYGRDFREEIRQAIDDSRVVLV
ncbi:MAG: toll/interleukin-1 receptor domain-containing protein, partial [Bacteroidota bacterium]